MLAAVLCWLLSTGSKGSRPRAPGCQPLEGDPAPAPGLSPGAGVPVPQSPSTSRLPWALALLPAPCSGPRQACGFLAKAWRPALASTAPAHRAEGRGDPRDLGGQTPEAQVGPRAALPPPALRPPALTQGSLGRSQLPADLCPRAPAPCVCGPSASGGHVPTSQMGPPRQDGGTWRVSGGAGGCRHLGRFSAPKEVAGPERASVGLPEPQGPGGRSVGVSV